MPRVKSQRTCEYCGTSYSKTEHYERHVRTHTREKPFCCGLCSSKFSRRDTLRRHTRACHPDASLEGFDADTVECSPQQEQTPLTDHSEYHESFVVDSGPLNQAGGDAEYLQTSNLPLSDPLLATNAPLGDFEWQWDHNLNLDSSFSIGGLCTSDPNIADFTTPWLPLRPSTPKAIDPNLGSYRSRKVAQQQPEWFTDITPVRHSISSIRSSRAHTPATTRGDISRDALESSLRQSLPDTTLPSAEFLNRCIHTFTTKLWPVIPIFHLPTFQPARTHPLLLLSICSLGALADGSKQSLYHAEKLFEGVQKAILVAWSPERLVDESALPVLQAAAIGQTFALLSGQPIYLLHAQSFHGQLSTAIRKHYSLVLGKDKSATHAPGIGDVGDWYEWIRLQSLIRLIQLSHTHNGEIAAIVQEPAQFRTQPLKALVAAPDNLFLARTAEIWANLQCNDASNSASSLSTFSSYAILECFNGEISHSRCSPFGVIDTQCIDDYQKPMQAWFLDSVESFRTDRLQRLSVLMLWHSCFIALLCDIDLLERSIGKDGSSLSDAEEQELCTWSLTPRAKRCVAHAVLLCRLMDDFRTSDVPAIHVPRSLWHAGLVLAVYSSLTSTDSASNAASPVVLCPGIDILQRSALSKHDWTITEEDICSSRCGTLAFAVSTTLRHLGPWPIAALYASTLDQVLNVS